MKECEFYPTGSENLNRLKKGSGQFYNLINVTLVVVETLRDQKTNQKSKENS